MDVWNGIFFVVIWHRLLNFFFCKRKNKMESLVILLDEKFPGDFSERENGVLFSEKYLSSIEIVNGRYNLWVGPANCSIPKEKMEYIPKCISFVLQKNYAIPSLFLGLYALSGCKST